MELAYRKYMGKAEFEKALHTLEGMIGGIIADQSINESEIEELEHWCLLHTKHLAVFPFKEVVPRLRDAISDGVLSQDEIDDILWLCNSYLGRNEYFDVITADIQTLHGLLHGILSDGRITEEELRYLKSWLDDNSHLESVYPYDEVYALIYKVMEDGKVQPEEEQLLKAFFTDFIDTTVSYNINPVDPQIKKEMNIQGICALGPNVEFVGKTFCFTGESSRMVRSEIKEIVTNKGGQFKDNVINETSYLVIGDGGNPCWAFSCYGRKVEKAIKLRKQGKPIVIVHEIDFWDALG